MKHTFEGNRYMVLNAEKDNNIIAIIGKLDGKTVAINITVPGEPLNIDGDDLVDEICEYHVEYSDMVDEQIKLLYGIEFDLDNGDEIWV